MTFLCPTLLYNRMLAVCKRLVPLFSPSSFVLLYSFEIIELEKVLEFKKLYLCWSKFCEFIGVSSSTSKGWVSFHKWELVQKLTF